MNVTAPDPMVAEAYRIGVKQLGEDEFEAKVEDTVAAIADLLKKRLTNDPQGMVTALVALYQALRRDLDGLP